MNKKSLEKIQIIDEYVTKMNKELRGSPFSFMWCPPFNHKVGNELDYFCILLSHSLVQETVEGEHSELHNTKAAVLGNEPLYILYYFGQAKRLDERVKTYTPSKLYEIWQRSINRTMTRYNNALTSIARGYKNLNFQLVPDPIALAQESKKDEVNSISEGLDKCKHTTDRMLDRVNKEINK